jgi:TolB-like protein
MKLKNNFIRLDSLILVLFIAGCSAGLLTRKIQVQHIGKPSVYDTKALVTVQFRSPAEQRGRDFYLSDLENSIRNSILNSGQFKEVHLKSEGNNRDYDVFFEVTVTPSDNGRTIWIISWPAVYPMPLYWPLQQKKGNAEVQFEVKVITADNPDQQFYIKKETPYFIRFYSFFKTGPIEDALQASYYDAIDELSQKVQKMSFAPAVYEEKKLEVPPGQKVNIAVLDLEALAVSLNEARTLTDKLRGELVRTGKFQVIERAQMLEILNEQGFQQTGMCNTDECYVEAGKLLGVEQLIGGSIGKVGSIYLISIRLIAVETGLIVKLVDEEVEGSVDDVLRRGIRSVAQKMSR